MLAQVLTDPPALSSGALAQVLAAGLGGALRARLPQGDPRRDALRAQALDLALRHAQVRAEVHSLLAVWAAEGIHALLCKGFALAEFDYASPGERVYGDVDVLLPEDPGTVMRAAHLALAHGWRSDGQHAAPESWTHETAHLYSPGGAARLDVHRWVTARFTAAGDRRLRDLTAGVWQRAERVSWEGVEILRPHPLDAAVVHLALGRCWGGDSGSLKPADYLDLDRLRRKHGLSASDLRRHAAGLGAAGTWAAFGALCDPERGVLHLDPARTGPVVAAGLRADGLSFRRSRWQDRARALPRVGPHLPAALGDVLAAWWAVRRGGDPRGHLRRWTPARPPRRLAPGDLEARLKAVSWWTRLLYPRQRRRGVCVPRAYASYRLLRRAGHPAVFVSGAAREHGTFVAHAWIEEPRGALDAYGEPLNRRRFRVVFRYPAES